jgi:hypothetical protein
MQKRDPEAIFGAQPWIQAALFTIQLPYIPGFWTKCTGSYGDLAKIIKAHNLKRYSGRICGRIMVGFKLG